MLPEDTQDFLHKLTLKSKTKETWILKPDQGAQGKGIRLVQTVEQVGSRVNASDWCRPQSC